MSSCALLDLVVPLKYTDRIDPHVVMPIVIHL